MSLINISNFQCEPPRDVEAYIHRSGRTGRAGRSNSVTIFFLLMMVTF